MCFACLVADTEPCFASGGNAFTVDLWGKDSDPFLHAAQFFATVGCAVCVQVAKLFLAERESQLEYDLFRANTTGEAEPVQEPRNCSLNVTEIPTAPQSHIENAYFIFGTLCFIGSTVQFLSWFHSGCKFSHWTEATEREEPSLPSPQSLRLTKVYFSVATFLLCLFAFLSAAVSETFIGFAIIFAVNTLDWTKIDASNLITRFVLLNLHASSLHFIECPDRTSISMLGQFHVVEID